ncbi:hypothetical protein FSP39_005285 [Pinctada imbricata]|uniref:Laminin subunit gamma-1 n=1 Tax=Pinctada imbricata TaxID=66713 RepID=A0AA89BYI6_PINIB|nr:hypothetical protein FSP39_005285 [Pinctada imbricata]
MTDYNNPRNVTWWQSETMLEGIQYPTIVNLTLNLDKAYDVTYVRLRFRSPRPESFAIYKKVSVDDDRWTPFQFYSASCESTYNKETRGIVTEANEATALCTDEYSGISPLTGGTVPFSTLEGRPSAQEFQQSGVLQDWVKASAIRIVLTRMNTFGDEVFGDARVLKSYFYAISDLAVGARCHCNGHARRCVDNGGKEVCLCEHNTAGDNCEKCRPDYNDVPWGRATESDAHECQQCNCNGKADGCYFDEALFQRTGRGGHCIDCRENTDGPNCERCKDNHFERPGDRYCTPCDCNPTGSESLQCDAFGKCRCKPGVTGDKCDRCEENHYDFSVYGCRPCDCNAAGSYDNVPRCNPVDGKCVCKENVEGRTCDSCKIGYFALRQDDPSGCIPCFCYGHSSDCTSSTEYYAFSLDSDFTTGKQRWTAEDRSGNVIPTQYNGIQENIGVSAPGFEPVFFVAPAKYLGDQRFSYNQFLSFDFRIGERDARPSVIDILFESGDQRFSSAIYVQGNKMPNITTYGYRFRLNERPTSQWTPRLKAQDFIAVLANLTALKIRATYNTQGVGFIDNVQLDSARLGTNTGDQATWVEQCTCPDGYVGQFCESCAGGYKRDPPQGGPFSMCVPCECFGHSDSCEPESGRCICQHNTEGDFCERCVSGYYGDARAGTPDDCKPCPCPDGGPCVQLPGGDVVCTQCKPGHGGNLCDVCLDGFYGDPAGNRGNAKPCDKCSCNENIDPNAVRNCDRDSGECLKCIYNTAGFYCENCLPNYYGDALAIPKGNCSACNCYPAGTMVIMDISCDPNTGQCACMSHVEGRQCDRCQPGYWNIDSGSGCENCNCNPVGSTSTECEIRTGQCQCKPGVTGLKCDQCMRYHYGFSDQGCLACNCDPAGSTDLQCDNNGYCPCQTNIEGRRCDRCQENKYNISAGCLDCPTCYNLVQEKVNMHRDKLRELKDLVINIGNNPNAFNDTEFLSKMNMVNDSVVMLLDEARATVSDDGTVSKQLSDLRRAVREVMIKFDDMIRNIRGAEGSARDSLVDVRKAREAIDRAERTLKMAEDYIDLDGQRALQRAQEALKKFGQQSKQMTQIAQQAKKLADSQMEEAKRIESIANDALNTSREAQRIANEMMAMPDKQRTKYRDSGQSIYGDADQLFNQTRVLAERARESAVSAYDEALALYTEARSITLPSFDVDMLLRSAENIRREAEQIKAEAMRLMRENEGLINDVRNQKAAAEGLLNDGISKQQNVDLLLAEVDVARNMAREAVSRAEKTLIEANNTLQILLGFDRQVKESKGEAEDALQNIPEIENLIEQAENKTEEAGKALSGAETDANMALSMAKLARETATNASQEASRIRGEARTTKERALNLKDQADNLHTEVNDTAEQINNYENEAVSDAQLTEIALQKADQAKTTARSVSDDVMKALETVRNISTLLGQLTGIDMSKLDELERDLNDAETLLMDAELQRKYDQLNEANDNIQQLVTQNKYDLNQLEMEVDNIREIKEALPDGCYKNIGIENPGSQ